MYLVQLKRKECAYYDMLTNEIIFKLHANNMLIFLQTYIHLRTGYPLVDK